MRSHRHLAWLLGALLGAPGALRAQERPAPAPAADPPAPVETVRPTPLRPGPAAARGAASGTRVASGAASGTRVDGARPAPEAGRPAAPSGGENDLAGARSLFAATDADQSGGLSLDETAAAGLSRQVFQILDHDVDGSVSVSEFVVGYRQALAEARRPVAPDLEAEATRLLALRKSKANQSRRQRAQSEAEPAPPAPGVTEAPRPSAGASGGSGTIAGTTRSEAGAPEREGAAGAPAGGPALRRLAGQEARPLAPPAAPRDLDAATLARERRRAAEAGAGSEAPAPVDEGPTDPAHARERTRAIQNGANGDGASGTAEPGAANAANAANANGASRPDAPVGPAHERLGPLLERGASRAPGAGTTPPTHDPAGALRRLRDTPGVEELPPELKRARLQNAGSGEGDPQRPERAPADGTRGTEREGVRPGPGARPPERGAEKGPGVRGQGPKVPPSRPKKGDAPDDVPRPAPSPPPPPPSTGDERPAGRP